MCGAGTEPTDRPAASEAIELRRVLGDVDIFVLMPLAGDEAHVLREHDLVPCLFDSDGIDQWIESAPARGAPARAGLHVDTGIGPRVERIYV